MYSSAASSPSAPVQKQIDKEMDIYVRYAGYMYARVLRMGFLQKLHGSWPTTSPITGTDGRIEREAVRCNLSERDMGKRLLHE